MAWHSHIDKLSTNIASSIAAIKRIKPFFSPEIPHIHDVLVQPHFDYCIAAKRSLKITNNSKVVLLAFWLLPSMVLTLGTCYNNLAEKTWLPSVKFKYSSFDKVFKALNDLAPDYLSSMFTERSRSGYVLRDSSNKLNVPLPRTNHLKRSLSYRGATLWSSLPCNIRQVKSLNIVLSNC